MVNKGDNVFLEERDFGVGKIEDTLIDTLKN
jgi:hypothetical protein